MRETLKRIRSISAAAVLVAAMAGCGSAGTPAGNTTNVASPASDAKKTVPDLTGKSFPVANNLLNNDGLSGVAFGKDGKEWKSRYPEDANVLSSVPAAGSSTDEELIRLNIDMNEADVIAAAKAQEAAAKKTAAHKAAAEKKAAEKAAAAKRAAEEAKVKPKVYSGFGDDVLAISKHDTGAEALTIQHTGPSNFAVHSLDSSLDSTDLLVNEIGNYSGTVLLDGGWSSTETSKLKITAGGAWTITLVPLQKVKSFNGKSPITGFGDDVFYYTGEIASATFTHDGSHNIAVKTHGLDSDLLVNEIGPYTGTLVWRPGLYSVTADGNWSATIK
ncbi:PASTA domain-containing protein [Arthrobacter sp. AFG20]|uniref:PASTA domain-containing protein n=1 Tax=Arthrobacter sp. AFG20 TaxID=1688671 RepID=UPI0015E1537F|nr:PASTA domain-containing protein [Arthrobacter sp. AFG20]